ncbi:MAG: hypothetical protein FWC89_06835 [Defluviitaleaceae bacterium]|nr:hypothetical protein [Defluviitaleaceae bacterium]
MNNKKAITIFAVISLVVVIGVAVLWYRIVCIPTPQIALPLQSSPYLEQTSLTITMITPQVVRYTIHNNTEHYVGISQGVILEYFNGSQWVIVPRRTHQLVSLVMPIIAPYSTESLGRKDLTNYRPLETGERYRIRLTLSLMRNHDIAHDLIAEFYWE